MKNITIISAVMLLLSQITLAQWSTIHPYPGGKDFENVFFISPDSGWISGNQGSILFTSDEGHSWEFQESNTDQTLSGIHFIDNEQGWIVGSEGTILHTTDAGLTWSLQDCPTDKDLLCVYFIDDSGWIAGEEGTILHSTDGGEIWESQTSGTEKALTSIHFFDNNYGGAAGNEGAILHTSDGGLTWEDQSTGNQYDHFSSIHFFDQMYGKVLEDYKVYETVDGGSTWNQIFTSPFSLISASFLNPDEVWLLGLSDIDWFYFALYTGDNFQSYDVMVGFDDGTSIFFSDHEHGWVVGSNALISHTADAGNTWDVQGTSLFSSFNDISANGIYHVWVVGENGVICHTSNHGWDWSFQTSGTSSELLSVCFQDMETGWAAGTEGTMIHTENGGLLWAEQITNTSETIKDVYFIDPANGWCTGSNGLILNTNTGGNEWEPQNSGTNEELRSIWFIDQQKGWITGGGSGIILHTKNGGQTWTQQYQDGEPLLKIHFVDEDHGWACGKNLLKTTDGGNTWSTLPGIDPYDVYLDIWFVDFMNGWTIALYHWDDTQYHDIHYTADGGENWTKQHVNGAKRSLFFSDHDNGWSVGDELVFKTTNGGGVFSVQEANTNSPPVRVYPNPCSGAVHLRCQISDIGYLIVDLYSITGCKIRRLMNEKRIPGTYDMEIDLGGLPAGIFVLELQTPETIKTTKLIKF